MSGWACFDRVYCISLEERPDRRAEATAQFAAVGLLERVEFVIVKKCRHDPEQGVYASHMICINKALAAGAGCFIIFEDDIVFDGFDGRRLKEAMDFLSTETDWHMFFLGCMVRRSRRTRCPSVVKIQYRSLTHACVLNPGFAETLSRISWQNVPYDDTLRDLSDDHTYALYPAVAFQSNSRSDNDRYLPLDAFRRICGGLRGLQRLDEFYHLHRPLILAAHAVAACGLIAWWVS